MFNPKFACVTIVALACTAAAAAPFYRPGREVRTLNTDSYEIMVQKNGRLNVRLISGEPVFSGAYPMIWYDGAKEPVPLPIDGRWSTRMEVNDRLGQGQGMLLKKRECDWIINTYPTKPFLTVQVAYTNASSKPVKVKMLLPWCVGDPKGGGMSLGSGTAQSVSLQSASMFPGSDQLPQLITGGPARGIYNLAVLNPGTGRSLIAGFLTHAISYGEVRIELGEKAEPDEFSLARMECVFDPPIEVPPDGRLQSELLYLGITETNPHQGLERFGLAMAVVNGVNREQEFLPHGWDSWNTKYRTDINEEKMLAALDFVDRNLKRYGWTHFAIDDGWQIGRGDWEPNPERFPHGMKWFADQVHARRMTAGLWTAPFTVSVNSTVAKEHPDWLVGPSALGKLVVNETERIVDVTVPSAYDYVKRLCARIGKEWGFDAMVEADYAYHLLLAESYHDPTLTRVEIYRLGWRAVREGFGDRKFIMSMTPMPITGSFCDGIRIGNDCAPIWRKVPDKWPWGCVETLTNAARLYYFSRAMWVPDQDCAYFGHVGTRQRWDVTAQPQLTWDQSIAWLTGAALTGGVIKIGDCFTDLNEQEVAALRKLTPVPSRPARPVDLFERENPTIWSLPIKTEIGEWQVVGVFNWDDAAEHTIAVDFSRLGLNPEKYYTVYDFWRDRYYGTARERVDLNVPAGSVCLLGLRPYLERPMFLSTDRHFTQGATDFTALSWDEAARVLSGVFDGIEDTVYNLRVLVPENFTVRDTKISCGPVQTSMDGRVLKIGFHCARQGPVDWSVQF
ncbi:MAG: alpha-galactosidase [Candidatus Hydrogenedentes bacterium]|nr:alpha-galactosidase [Candidatus Hydrogenedentota bacterium]